MRLFAILLFAATMVLGLSELGFHYFGAVRDARSKVTVLGDLEKQAEPSGRISPMITEKKKAAQQEQQEAERNAKPFFYMQIVLTIVTVPFCMWLVLTRYQDTATKTFGFTSLGSIIAFWFYIPKT